MKDGLLGCPFCGARPVIDDDGERVIIKCVANMCGVEPRTFAVLGLDEAREEWNMRAPDVVYKETAEEPEASIN